MNMLSSRWLGVTALALAQVACAIKSAQLHKAPEEVPANKIFELTVELGAPSVKQGEAIRVTYHFMNVTDSSARVCPTRWDEFFLYNNATKFNKGSVVYTGRSEDAEEFTLPARATLTWSREVELPRVGVGEATFLGKVESFCATSSGTVWAKPASILIVSRDDASAPASGTR